MGRASTYSDTDGHAQTRCSSCGTVFEIAPELLSSVDTRVRCGDCHAIFDARANLVEPDAEAPPPASPVSSGPSVASVAGASRPAAAAGTRDASASRTDDGSGAFDVTYSDFDLFSGEAELPEVAYLDETVDTPEFDFGTIDSDAGEGFDDVPPPYGAAPRTTATRHGRSASARPGLAATDDDGVAGHTAPTGSPPLGRRGEDGAAGPGRADEPSPRDATADLAAPGRDAASGHGASHGYGAAHGDAAAERDAASGGDTTASAAGVASADDTALTHDAAPVHGTALVYGTALVRGTAPVYGTALAGDAAHADDAAHEALAFVSAPGRPSRGAWLTGTALTLLLGALLLGLYAYRERDRAYNDVVLRPLMVIGCRALGCEVPSRVALDALTLQKRDVFSHPTRPDALAVDLVFRNSAAFAQRYPIVVVRLRDRVGRVVAEHDFAPGDYLDGWQAGDTLAAGERLEVVLDIDDPGTGADSYEFEFREASG